MKKMKLIGLLVFVFAATFSFAQDNQPQTADATTVKSRGADPNIVSDEMVNVKGKSEAVRPASKGGTARGGNCYAWFDNWTAYIVNVYVDGTRRGAIDGFGNGGVYVETGNTKLYSVMRFDDGSSISYGPETQYCGNGDTFTMEIHDDFYNWSVK